MAMPHYGKGLRSARVSRVGDGILAIADLSYALEPEPGREMVGKFVSAQRPFDFTQGRLLLHARCVRYPIIRAARPGAAAG